MTQPNLRTNVEDMANLEMLGLLASRIIHDIKNKFAIVAGHAQFAEIMKNNPKSMGDTISTIKRVCEDSVKHLDQLSKFRRALPGELGFHPEIEVAESCKNYLASQPGWNLLKFEPLKDKRVLLPPRMVIFLLRFFVQSSIQRQGDVEISHGSLEIPLDGVDVSPLEPDKEFMQIVIKHKAPASIPIEMAEDLRFQLQQLAVPELLRRNGGGLIKSTNNEGMKTITLLIPVA